MKRALFLLALLWTAWIVVAVAVNSARAQQMEMRCQPVFRAPLGYHRT